VGPRELIIILVIALLLFGAKRLPELGRSLGSGMREFKGAVTGSDRDDEDREALNEGANPVGSSETTQREGAAQPRA